MKAASGIDTLAGDAALPRLVGTLCLAGFAAALLLNLHHIAWWAALFAMLTIVWRLRASWTTHQLPGRRQLVLVVGLLIVAVALNFRALNGLPAGATLLAAMTSAKLLETRRPRDWYIIIFAAMFLLLAACLDRQQLWRLPLYLAALWLLAVALRGVGSGSRQPRFAELARASLRALLYAVPLALVLFLLFPRLPGGFWAIPAQDQAVTGLGEELSPGSISQLSESDAVALRVRFDGPLPLPAERYWRGPVLHDFDGYTWRRGYLAATGNPPQLQPGGNTYRYEAWLEPNQHQVLIALDLPTGGLPPGARLTEDYQLRALRPIDQARTYELTSATGQRDPAALPKLSERRDLALPPERNRRSVALARELRTGAADPAAFVAATLDWLRRGGFEYTLTPPRLNLDSVDELLFGTRQGFCGHYASAFATLMRAGDVPARVVTGYLGGEWNPVGRYLVLRQSHAHAWVEVWLDGIGWQRVDPTAVVAPERLTRDIFDLLGAQAASPARALRATPWIARVIQSVEALNAWWQDGVLGYDYRRQLAFFGRIGLGEGEWQRLAILLGGLSTLWIAWVAWSLRDQWRPLRSDPAARLWHRFEARMRRRGLQRELHEGPSTFAARVAAAQPALADAAGNIAASFTALRYGPPQQDRGQLLATLRRELARL